eukprot:SAG31_NODE_5050_length_2775_cov_2.843423_3_plen_237_part_00
MPTRDALLVVGLSATVADEATRVLLGHGFATALDLRLLVGRQLQVELAAGLKTSGLSIGDRAKIQLLIGDGAVPTNAPLCEFTVSQSTPWSEFISGEGDGGGLRRQQTDGDGGLSTDTLAITLSVLVGAVGCELPPRVCVRAIRLAFCLSRVILALLEHRCGASVHGEASRGERKRASARAACLRADPAARARADVGADLANQPVRSHTSAPYRAAVKKPMLCVSFLWLMWRVVGG